MWSPWGVHEDYVESMGSPWKPVGDCKVEAHGVACCRKKFRTGERKCVSVGSWELGDERTRIRINNKYL
jgi:hypothetical protein